MGRRTGTAPSLADALFSRVQQRVLSILFSQPERSFQGAEIIRLAESGTGAVHRELTRLAASGLVTVTRVGNQKHYRANPESPIYTELHGLVVKTVGLLEPLREALAPWAAQIKAAFVYGSVAKGNDKANSDIDLMVIAEDISYPDVYAALQSVEALLHRSVNPNLSTPAEWKRKLAEGSPFVVKVQARPKLFIIGAQDAIA